MGLPIEAATTESSATSEPAYKADDGKETTGSGEDQGRRCAEQRQAGVEQAMPAVRPDVFVDNEQVRRKKVATAAAITAVHSAAPGQRERVVADAVYAASTDAPEPYLREKR